MADVPPATVSAATLGPPPAAPAAAPPAAQRVARPSLAARLPGPGTGGRRREVGPEEVLDRFVEWTADAGFALYRAQEEALLEIAAGRHVILNTPTGSGKSLVALGLHFK